MQCTHPITLKTRQGRYGSISGGLQVPCGKCVACRVNRAQEWSVRLLHELDCHSSALFVTLTYDQEHVPYIMQGTMMDGLGSASGWSTLVKRHVQLFVKRLRKICAGRKLLYYISGEYSPPPKDRPHYHGIVYGLSLHEHLRDVGNNEGIVLSGPLFDAWPHGLIHVGTVTSDSISYVARYIDTKLYGDLADIEYRDRMRAPPFSLSSQGLGLSVAQQDQARLRDNLFVSIKGRRVPVPRYYRKKLFSDVETIRLSQIAFNRLLNTIHNKKSTTKDQLRFDIAKSLKQSEADIQASQRVKQHSRSSR